jgi:plasmid segregation protein ParM
VFIKETLNEYGIPTNATLFNGYVLVIDPGFRTTDIATFYDGVMLDPPNSFSIEKGLKWTYIGVAERLKEMTCNHENPIETDDKELDKIFRLMEVFIPGKWIIKSQSNYAKYAYPVGYGYFQRCEKGSKPNAQQNTYSLSCWKSWRMVFNHIQLNNKILIDDPAVRQCHGI